MNIPTFLPGAQYAAHPRGSGPALALPPRWIVIHDTGNTASAVTETIYAATRTDDRGSWTSAHFYVDDIHALGSVPLDSQAWAAFSNANAHAWQIEMCGRDAGTPNAVSEATLRHTADLVAQLVKLAGIPVTHIGPAAIGDGLPGIAGHYDFTIAEHRAGGHTDPGPSFDWDHFLAMVDTALGQQPPTTPPAQEDPVKALPLLKSGATGQPVKNMQALLNAHAWGSTTPVYLAEDGEFGPKTDAALRSFQATRHVPNSVTATGTGDGQCGVHTWAALLDVA